MKIDKLSKIVKYDSDNIVNVCQNLDINSFLDSFMIFIRNDMLFNRDFDNILQIDLPDNWTIIQLNENNNFTSPNCEYVRKKKITNDYGFIIRKRDFTTLKTLLKKTPPIESLNTLITDKICYSFYQNLIWPAENIDVIDYYRFFYKESIFNETVNHLQQYISKISIRHQLQNLPRYINIDTILQIFDYKLNIKPSVVNELITIGMIDIEYKNIEEYLKNYQKGHKTITLKKYLDKSVINLFFDIYIYCQKPMCVVIPSYNNILNYVRNLDSIFNQKYFNYRIIYADDRSTDGTYEAVCNYIIERKMYERANVYRQSSHNAQCCGRYMCYLLIDDDEIVCNVDGDDWMYDRNDQHQYNGFKYIEESYNNGYLSTYGCFYKSSGPQWMETTLTYSQKTIQNKEYRTNKFLCKHLRTGYAGFYKNIQINDLLDTNFKFLHMCTDICTQYSILEMSGERHVNILKPTYIYNQDNSINYDNSWYNLDKATNIKNKEYNDFVQQKVRNRSPYATENSINLDKWYDYNLFNEKLDIIILNEKNINLHQIKNKIKHELKNVIKYSIAVVESLQQLIDLSKITIFSNIILYINSDYEISANLNINKYLKFMLTTKINKIMISDNLNCNDSTAISFENNSYSISITKLELTIQQSSGYYTCDTFTKLLQKKVNDDIKLFIKSFNHITYIVALYNISQKWLEDCIESLKNQTTTNFNIIINDDKTENLNYLRSVFKYLNNIKSLIFGNRLTLSQSKKNLGLAGNNKYMIGLTESNLIACLDPDDAIISETTDELDIAYKSNPDFVYSNFYYCDEALQIKTIGFCKNLSNNNLVLNENCISHIRSYRKNSYYKTIGYDTTFRSAEDKDIIFKFEEIDAIFKHISKPLYLYRHNSNSLTKNGATSFNNHKTLQYCKTAISLSYYRRIINNFKMSNVDLINLWKKYGMGSIYETIYEQYFNNFFDKIYVINLQDNTINYNNMAFKLSLITNKNVKFIRFKAASKITTLSDVYDDVICSDLHTSFEKKENRKSIKSIGEIGCLESHLWCLKDADNNKYSRILILEDDVYFDKHFLIKFYEYTSCISSDWRYMLLGSSQWSWWGNKPHINKWSFPPTRASMGTFAVAINKVLIPNLINNMSTYDGPSDLGGYSKTIIKLNNNESIHSTAHIIENRANIDKCHVLYPNLISADTRQSHIRTVNTDIDFIQRCKNMEWKLKNKNVLTNNCIQNTFKYDTVIVDDYDHIYTDKTLNPKHYYLKITSNLPYNIHSILSENIQNIISVSGDILNSDFCYYKTRMQHFKNIIFDNI